MVRIILGIVGVLVVLGLCFILWSYLTKPASTGTTTTPSGPVFPVSGGSQTGTTGNSSQTTGTITLTDRTNTAVQAKDFINNGSTVPDAANPGDYEIAGSLGYCSQNPKCVATNETDYNIGYDSSSQTFTIALLTEPIGRARSEAEQFLLSTLGVSQAQLCNLKYYVGTTYYVNEQYDNRNLGFSFCPGAVPLPN